MVVIRIFCLVLYGFCHILSSSPFWTLGAENALIRRREIKNLANKVIVLASSFALAVVITIVCQVWPLMLCTRVLTCHVHVAT